MNLFRGFHLAIRTGNIRSNSLRTARFASVNFSPVLSDRIKPRGSA